jgi:hypothetical protein
MHHLGAEEAVLHLAARAHPRALGQLLDLAAVEIQEAQLQRPEASAISPPAAGAAGTDFAG